MLRKPRRRSLDLDATCSVCFEAPPISILKPCNHNLCPKCSARLDRCPLCRAPVDEFVTRFQVKPLTTLSIECIGAHFYSPHIRSVARLAALRPLPKVLRRQLLREVSNRCLLNGEGLIELVAGSDVDILHFAGAANLRNENLAGICPHVHNSCLHVDLSQCEYIKDDGLLGLFAEPFPLLEVHVLPSE